MLVDAYGRFTPAELSVLRDFARQKGLSFAASLRLIVSDRFPEEIAVKQKAFDAAEKRRLIQNKRRRARR